MRPRRALVDPARGARAMPRDQYKCPRGPSRERRGSTLSMWDVSFAAVGPRAVIRFNASLGREPRASRFVAHSLEGIPCLDERRQRLGRVFPAQRIAWAPMNALRCPVCGGAHVSPPTLIHFAEGSMNLAFQRNP